MPRDLSRSTGRGDTGQVSTRREFLAKGVTLGLTPVFLGGISHGSGVVGAGGPSADQGTRGRRQISREPGELVLALVGDIFLLRPISDGWDTRSLETAGILGECDLVIGNLENGLSTVGHPDLGGMRYGPSLRGHPDLVEELHRYHVGAVSLANNHTGNYGPEALLETMQILDGAGIGHAGAGRTPAEAFSGSRLEVGGLTVGLLSAYSYYYEYEADDIVTPDRPGIAGCRAFDVVLGSETRFDYEDMRPDTRPAWLVPLAHNSGRVEVATLREDLGRLAEATRKAREDVDFLIVSFHVHWGRHYRSDLPFHQRALAQTMVDAGADLVVGHGPHAVRGAEVYRGRGIVHSIGNFLLSPTPLEQRAAMQPRGDPNRESVILVVRLRPGSYELEFLPIGIEADGRPRLLQDDWGQEILDLFRGLSTALGTQVSIEPGIASIEVGPGIRAPS